MLAGVVLPSAAALISRSRLETLIYRSAILCREAFERAIYSGRQYRILLQSGELKAESMTDEQGWQPEVDVWMQPVVLPPECLVDWPEEGWLALPEGFCESPTLRFHDSLANETIFVRIRPYDACFARESADASGQGTEP